MQQGPAAPVQGAVSQGQAVSAQSGAGRQGPGMFRPTPVAVGHPPHGGIPHAHPAPMPHAHPAGAVHVGQQGMFAHHQPLRTPHVVGYERESCPCAVL